MSADKIRWGKYIRDYRVKHNMIQEEMAELLSATQSQVSKWENGLTPSVLRRSIINERLNLGFKL